MGTPLATPAKHNEQQFFGQRDLQAERQQGEHDARCSQPTR